MKDIPVKIINKSRSSQEFASCPTFILGATGKKGSKKINEIFKVNKFTLEKKTLWKRK